MSALHDWLQRVWFKGAGGGWVLAPLTWMYALVSSVRRVAYQSGLRASIRVSCPVIIVGNLSVGGTGKTPLTIALAQGLTRRGMRVGIISRGYGGTSRGPERVKTDTSPFVVGDEAVVMARRTLCPVVVARERVAAARHLARDVDVLISDDGLQHLRLARDFEIVVIDGARRFGNGKLLPQGPLREPVSRLASVDALVVHGTGAAGAGEIEMQLSVDRLVALQTGAQLPVTALQGKRVHAVAGIGCPERFFDSLRSLGMDVIEHPLRDHVRLRATDLQFGDDLPVVMTEKDAVKCGSFAGQNQYFLSVSASLDAALGGQLLDTLEALVRRPRS